MRYTLTDETGREIGQFSSLLQAKPAGKRWSERNALATEVIDLTTGRVVATVRGASASGTRC